MKVLVTRALPEAVLAPARHLDLTVRDAAEGLTLDEARDALGTYDAILATLGDRFDAAAFDGRPRSGLIANFGVGYSHIDVSAARAAGVAVTNTPDVLTDATADIGMMLVLMTARRAGEGERLLRAGQWGGFGPGLGLGRDVTGARLGIVGMGRIGQAVARRGHFGFGMEVAYHSRSKKALDHPAERMGLEALMGWADFVVICVPGGAETTGLIGADAIAAMQPDAHLVNISRGEVVDEGALIEALASGAIAGAGLDVYSREPHVPEALIAQPNAVLLPHIGSATRETRAAMGRLAMDNVLAFAAGGALLTPV
ncbi:MAG: 2-hydroxyacid dehydrogenase [Paracoccaceae bacterium]